MKVIKKVMALWELSLMNHGENVSVAPVRQSLTEVLAKHCCNGAELVNKELYQSPSLSSLYIYILACINRAAVWSA